MAFYRHLFDEWPVAYACHRILYNHDNMPVDSVIVDVNKAFERLVGFDRNRILWRKATEVYKQAQMIDLDWNFFLQKALTYNKEFNYLFIWRGHYYEIKACCPERGFVAVTIEEARSLPTLTRAEDAGNLVLSALNGAEGIILVVDLQTLQVIYANAEAQNLYGVDLGSECPEEFAPRLANGDLYDPVINNPEQIQLQGAQFHQNFCDQQKSYLFLDYLLTWKNGQTVYIQVGTDMTHLKQAAVNSQKNEQKLKVTLQCVDEGIITFNERGRMEMMNKAAEQMTGWFEEEAIGREMWEVFQLEDKSGRRLKDPIRFLQEQKALTNGYEMNLIARNGTKRRIIGTFSFISDSSNTPIGTVVVFRDAAVRAKEKFPYYGTHQSIAHLENGEYKEALARLQVPENLPIAVLVGHLNGFKLISDTFGYSMGEKFIKSAEQCIDRLIRPDDIIVKWDGDEFAILLPRTTGEEARVIGKAIKEEILKINLNAMKNTVSIGYEVQQDFNESIYDMLERTSEFMYKQNLLENVIERDNAVNAMMRTLNEKSPREAMHSQHVSEMCKLIGKAMNLSHEEIYQLGTAGLLHDIGKTVIDAGILNKPGSLSEVEWQEIKRHPEIGYRILSSSGGMEKIAPFVLAHHERYDGTGYPNKLAGTDIPLQARILTLADSFDAMTMDRTYRKGLSKNQAAEEIKRNSGTQFDPKVVEIFLNNILPQFP